MELTTIGSRIQVEVAPSALPEAGEGGVALILALHDGPLQLALTAGEARELAALLTATAER
jgi:hypothetical protein